MAAGVESTMEANFPLGKPENNYTVEVIVKVMDNYDFSATAGTTIVQVSENIGNTGCRNTCIAKPSGLGGGWPKILGDSSRVSFFLAFYFFWRFSGVLIWNSFTGELNFFLEKQH